MQNLFPIQWLALVAYFILRLGIGILLIHYARRHLQSKQLFKTAGWPTYTFWGLVTAEVIAGILFIFGFLTQAAAILCITIGAGLITISQHRYHSELPPKPVLFLMIIIGMTLFITGAGVAAVDLPI
jgi:uncharacterized membrane protein YphA (DoxX/SURF4 family)